MRHEHIAIDKTEQIAPSLRGALQVSPSRPHVLSILDQSHARIGDRKMAQEPQYVRLRPIIDHDQLKRRVSIAQ